MWWFSVLDVAAVLKFAPHWQSGTWRRVGTFVFAHSPPDTHARFCVIVQIWQVYRALARRTDFVYHERASAIFQVHSNAHGKRPKSRHLVWIINALLYARQVEDKTNFVLREVRLRNVTVCRVTLNTSRGIIGRICNLDTCETVSALQLFTFRKFFLYAMRIIHANVKNFYAFTFIMCYLVFVGLWRPSKSRKTVEGNNNVVWCKLRFSRRAWACICY